MRNGSNAGAPAARAALAALTLAAGSAQAGWLQAGRPRELNRDSELAVTVGSITEVQGMVQETRRTLYDVTGSYWKQDDAERYDLNDFGMEGPYTTFGLSLAKRWRFVALEFESSVFDAELDAVAQRNYYIGVGDDIEFNGQSYDHMKIPEGTPFSMELVGALIDLKALITPCTFRPAQSVRLVPSLDLGLFGFVGQYEIDAGEAQGVTQYQNPLEDFVIGGEASGTVGLGLPEYGGGLELRLGAPQAVNFVATGHYTVCQYDGSTEYLVSSSHREKNADIDHSNLRVHAFFEFPMGKAHCLTMGVRYQKIDSSATITSTATDPDEILEKQERFDKVVEFSLESVQGMVGWTF